MRSIARPRTPLISISVFVASVIACGAPGADGASEPSRVAGGRPKGARSCAPSSVRSAVACPTRSVPKGDGSSPDACRSDADCKDGIDGRCIRGPGAALTPSAPDRRNAALLAGPPPPPPRALCVYDACRSDADCGAKSRCACGSGVGGDRHQCLPLDHCLADGDCAKDNICACAASGGANVCLLGDCHADADCDGLSCEANHCHTRRDLCRTSADCRTTPMGPSICSFDERSRRWECHALPPIPPG